VEAAPAQPVEPRRDVGTVSVIIASSWPQHAPPVQGNDLRAGAFRDAVGAPLPFALAAP